MLATSFRVIWEARWAHVDLLFCFFFTLTIVFGARAMVQKGGRHEILLAYAFMALATMTKGMIGMVLPIMILLAFVTARRDWRLLGALKLRIGIPIFVLLAGPWFYLVSRASGGRWLADFIYVHHIQRYIAGSGHQQPFHYYLTALARDFLPWTAFLIPAAIERGFRRSRQKPETQFCVVWFAVVFVFFSLSVTKRDLYLLPLFPPAALLVGHYVNDFAVQDWAKRGVNFWIALCLFVLVALAGTALPVAAWLLRPDVFWPIVPVGIAMVGGGGSTAMFVQRRKPFAAVLCVAAMMLALTTAFVSGLFPYLERFKSHREFSAEINRRVPRSAPLYVYEDTTNDFNYYTGRMKIPVIEGAAEIAALRSAEEKRYVLIKKRALEKMPEIAAEPVIATTASGNTIWYLLALGH